MKTLGLKVNSVNYETIFVDLIIKNHSVNEATAVVVKSVKFSLLFFLLLCLELKRPGSAAKLVLASV